MDDQSAHLLCLEGKLMNQSTPMNRLRDVRVLKRITQIQLRLSTGINQSKISLIENGYIKPKHEEVIKLSRALGVRPQDIFPESKRTNDDN